MHLPTSRRNVIFQQPYQVELCTEALPQPGAEDVVVQTAYSAISAGTEMLFYRGQVPAGMSADATIEGLSDAVAYPLTYGYACTGTVIGVGSAVPDVAIGAPVFVFHPHSDHLVVHHSRVIQTPAGMALDHATLVPNCETAVNLLMDGAPLIGERVVVLGLGIVGLLTTALLSSLPLEELIVIDPLATRRQLALSFGAHSALTPQEVAANVGQLDADLVYECSGSPAALNTAISVAGFTTRIVVCSWYGAKAVAVDLGGKFHRQRIRMISSQVSTIDPRHSGRWDSARRLQTAWRRLEKLEIEPLISHRYAIEEVADAYHQIDDFPESTLQVLLAYGGER